MKQLFEVKRFWRFLRTKKFYLPLCFATTVILVWISIELWKRWQIVALITGVLIAVLSGCKNVRLSNVGQIQ